MSLSHKQFDELAGEDILELRENRVAESRVIEYKRELPGNTDKEKKEFLADVSAFANTVGGDLLYGVEEDEEAIPKRFPGIANVNSDKAIQRLESLVQSSVRPRLMVQFKLVEVGPEAAKLVVARIARSSRSPHMVTHGGTSRFFLRDSKGKAQMDVDQIGASFLHSATFTDRVRQFRTDRARRPFTAGVPHPPRVILHLIPQGFLSPGTNIPINEIPQHRFYELASDWVQGDSFKHNFDGVLIRDDQGACEVQVFRSGIVEAMSSKFFWTTTNKLPSDPTHQNLNGRALEQSIIETTRLALAFQSEIGVAFPIWLMLTIVDVKGARMANSHRQRISQYPWQTFDRDLLPFSEVLMERDGLELPGLLRPLFDQMWNAAGHQGSFSYDKDGNWKADA